MPEINGQKVGDVGFGLLALTMRANPPSEEQAIAVMRASLALGCNLWNGGEFYGTPESNSMTLLKKYYERYPEDADKVVLNIKGGTRPGLIPDGSPEFVRESVENCLAMMGPRGKIDMFECARRDRKTPLKQEISALAQLVDEGKIGGVALSEVSAATIRDAATITKIVAVEIEFSLFHTEPLTNGIMAACYELDIPVIAYSPIGRGMLSGRIRKYEDLPEGDFRKVLPRFQPDAFENNMKLVKALEVIANRKSCTPAQLALSWISSIAKKPGMPQIIPIPGTTKVERVKENAVQVEVTEEELREIDEILSTCEIIGERYHPHGMTMVNG